MNISYNLKNLDEGRKAEVQSYFPEKLEDLRRYLGDVPEDSIYVQVGGEYFEKHDAYKITLAIEVKHGTSTRYYTEETKHRIPECIDIVKDEMKAQILKGKR